MGNQKPHDNDALVVLSPIHDRTTEPDTVVFTRAEWETDDESETFGMHRIMPKTGEKTPRAEAVLIFHDSFLRTKRRIEECTLIRPVIDLPKIVNAMIDICDAGPAVMEKIRKKMLERRAQQLTELQNRVRFGPSSEKQSG